MKILIVRHGEPDYSIDSLTPKGWIEAELLSKRLMQLPISDIYCSPLGRAQDTARATLGKLGREAVTLPWLREFAGHIIFPGETRKQIPWNFEPQFWTNEPDFFDKAKWLEHPLMQTGNVREIYGNTTRGIDDLLSSYGYIKDGYLYRCTENKDTTIVLFCHFALGMTILSYLLGVSPILLWHTLFMPTSSITTLVTEERRKGEVFFKCMQVGDTSHLYAADEPVSKSGLFPEFYTDLSQDGAKA